MPVPYEVAWKALEERAYPGVEGTFIHPFDDDDFITGHATMGLEILEDVPDVSAVIAGDRGRWSGDGCGSALRALKPDVKVWGAEPETAAPLARSFALQSAQTFDEWQPSFVDGAGGHERLSPHVGANAHDRGRIDRRHPEETRRAVRMIADRARSDRGGSRGSAAAAALTGRAGRGPIVAIVSGGNIDLEKLCDILAATD